MDTMIELRLHSCTHCLWKETALLLPMPVKFMLDSKEMLAAEATSHHHLCIQRLLVFTRC